MGKALFTRNETFTTYSRADSVAAVLGITALAAGLMALPLAPNNALAANSNADSPVKPTKFLHPGGTHRELGAALINAVQSRNVARAKSLLEKGAWLEATDRTGCTPLMYACGWGQREMIDLLLEYKQNLDIRARDGKTAFSITMSSIGTRVPERLLALGAGVEAPGPKGRRPLHYAAGNGDVELLKLLIENGAKPDARSDDGQTPLMRALGGLAGESESPQAVLGFDPPSPDRLVETARVLIAAGADVNAADAQGLTVYYYAGSHGADHRFLDLVQKAGARKPLPSVRSALDHDDVEELRAAAKAGANLNAPFDEKARAPIFQLLLSNKPKMLAVLIELSADPYLDDGHGSTPLEYAIMADGPGLLQGLLDGGVDPNHPNGEQLPLMVAARFNVDIESINRVRTLLDNKRIKIQVDARNSNGTTALMVAGSVEAASLLIERGADVKARDKQGSTVLVYAINDSFRETELLTAFYLKRGVDPNLANSEGITPLSVAVSHQDIKAARLLLNAGAKVDPRDRLGQTPLFWAAADGEAGIVRLLLQHGADPNAKVGKETPITIARKRGHTVVVKLLTGARQRVDGARFRL